MSARDVILIGVMVFALGLAFLAAHYAINNSIDRMVGSSVVNSSTDTVNALQATKTLTNRMDYVVFALFIGLSLALIITGYLIGGHPIFMIIYTFFIIIGVVIGAVLSNVFETISSHSTFLATVASFALTSHLMAYLPIYMAVVGFMGMIAMFAKPFMGGGQ